MQLYAIAARPENYIRLEKYTRGENWGRQIGAGVLREVGVVWTRTESKAICTNCGTGCPATRCQMMKDDHLAIPKPLPVGFLERCIPTMSGERERAKIRAHSPRPKTRQNTAKPPCFLQMAKTSGPKLIEFWPSHSVLGHAKSPCFWHMTNCKIESGPRLGDLWPKLISTSPGQA